MIFVVDTNILFSFFWEKSFTKKLFLNQDLELVSPEFSLVELNKYSEEIIKKAKITKQKFEDLKKELVIMVEFIPLNEYSEQVKKASKISPDKEDIDFFALSLKLNVPIWSNDYELKKQKRVTIYSTKELVEDLINDKLKS